MEFKIGEKNVLNRPLINPRKVLLSSLHIKAVCESLNQDVDCLKYLKFLPISCVKIKIGLLDELLNRRLLQGEQLLEILSSVECFVVVVSNFLGNNKLSNYKELMQKMLSSL